MFRSNQIIVFPTDPKVFVKRSLQIYQGEFIDKRVFVFDHDALMRTTADLSDVLPGRVEQWIRSTGQMN